MRTKHAIPILALALCLLAPTAARAFCGFYVGGADAKLVNNATMVVLMREGTRTVLSMANNYEGPPADFAMVVPVPIVLQKENVKTLPRDVFERVDALAAPRLVEYWEEDPCRPPAIPEAPPQPSEGAAPTVQKSGVDKSGVRIEARFSVGEYDILILSASDSMGLETWLHQNKYKIPAGAEPILRPYVQAGMKFFVAKVDVKKVRFEGNQALLSPLRFHYDEEKFGLPVRLGLLSSGGTQDLIVHILARGKRYEVSNYPNVAIPTNYDVSDATRAQFSAFYAALFDKTLSLHPGAVVTEYAWDAASCDPCPTPPLEAQSLLTLGADVLPGAPESFVLTRLHARYSKDSLGRDLLFREAPPIEGGREEGGALHQKHGASSASVNGFQARYAIRHPWTGPIRCENPQRGSWGGPPDGTPGDTSAKPALKVAFAPRGKVDLASSLEEPIPDLGITVSRERGTRSGVEPGARGCGSCGVEGDGRGLLPCAVAAFVVLIANDRRRRRRRARERVRG